jgi:hypothetical protein
MLRRSAPARNSFLFVGAVVSLACSSSPSGPVAVTVTVTPTPINVLTCSTTPFTATLTGTTETAVDWSITPATGAGTIGIEGDYSAPTTAPTAPNNSVTVTALTEGNPSQGNTTPPFIVATAFPGAPIPVPGSTGVGEIGDPSIGVYQHLAAASGNRVYATWVDNPAPPATEIKQMVARSDDGGATWTTPVPAIDATILGGSTTNDGSMDCPAIAVDPGNPDVVYTTATADLGNSLGASAGDPTGPAVVFSVSVDGGKTFTPTVLSTAFAAFDPCQDIASPAPNTVVVTVPGTGCNQLTTTAMDIYVWSDANRGAGFASGSLDSKQAFWASGLTGALDVLRGDPSCSTDLIAYDNGGDNDSAQAIESPRMFVDGHGRLCLVYAATSQTGAIENSYVQCSADAGHSFTQPSELDPALATDNQPSGTFGPGNAAAIAWTTNVAGADQQTLYIALSNDGGATFGAPIVVPTLAKPFSPSILYDASGVIWIAYRIDGGSALVVDKSCDEGLTFSGPVSASVAADDSLMGPSLLDTGAPAPRLFGAAEMNLASFSLSP